MPRVSRSAGLFPEGVNDHLSDAKSLTISATRELTKEFEWPLW